MNILSYKPGHDGHIACIEKTKLIFSHEAEKDSNYRYAPLEANSIFESLMASSVKPDILSISGWSVGIDPYGRQIGAGYWGIDPPRFEHATLLGESILLCSSSHERSHILSSYALSPFPQGEPCYALVWEGHIGCFYEIDRDLNISRLKKIMVDPGIRYSFVYALADPEFNLPDGMIRIGDAGKVMALAAFKDNDTRGFTDEEMSVAKQILANPLSRANLAKKDFSRYKVYNSGPESKHCKHIARLISNSILDHFLNSIKPLIRDKRPLLISGGCGLNCEWNTHISNSKLFSDVFVPPCTNDTGAAIGSAADAQFLATGNAKISWDVYCGQPFDDDLQLLSNGYCPSFYKTTKTMKDIALDINHGKIYAWINGKCEIGPRALGNRSLLASPMLEKNRERLNKIKRREHYRPIAPICIAEDYKQHFYNSSPNAYMLKFSKLRHKKLPAITHVDGTARAQTVTLRQNPLIYNLLSEFKQTTGTGVLCNTSLNFNGKGFINRSSDIVSYVTANDIDGFILEGSLFLPRTEVE